MFQVDPNFANLQYSVSHIPKCSTYIPILRIFNIPCAGTSPAPCVRAHTDVVLYASRTLTVALANLNAMQTPASKLDRTDGLSMVCSYQATLCQSRQSIQYCVSTRATPQYQVVLDHSRSPRIFYIRDSIYFIRRCRTYRNVIQVNLSEKKKRI